MQVAILGRQPSISVAELERMFGAEKIKPVKDYAACIDIEAELPQARLGGTIKSGKVHAKLENADLEAAFTHIQNTILEFTTHFPEGKLQFGVSIYGFKAQRDWLLRKNLGIKKLVKKSGRSIRIIENKSEVLEAAQVLYNKLTGPLGIEFLIIKDGKNVTIAQTTSVQNIDNYAARDFERPKRDAFVGMLPPKLAQIMINLAVGRESSDEDISKIQDLRSKICILDPFCGTGVVLQEAMLMRYEVYGTDLSEKMIRYSRDNLNWLTSSFLRRQESSISEIAKGDTELDWIPDQAGDDTPQWYLEQADATSHTWRQPIDAVVCETYLGTPLTTLPDEHKLTEIINEADEIAEKFLKNIAPQLQKGTRLCLALPAWYLGNNTFEHLKMLDHLTDLGYNRLDLVHAKKSDLIYHRENQTVARELTILVRS